MGSSKKNKKDRDSSTKRRSRSRSRSEESREKKRLKKHREKEREKRRRSSEKEPSYHSESSDVVEIVPELTKTSKTTKNKSPSPSAEGAGNSLSIEETNKLRAKLGLKPLEVGSTSKNSSASKEDLNEPIDEEVVNLRKVKDDLGEFYHKPAGQYNEKTECEILREKIQARKEKRKIEEKLKRIKTLAESDEDDDARNWVEKSRKIAEEKEKAKHFAKMFNALDEEFEIKHDKQANIHNRKVKEKLSSKPSTSSSYNSKDLQGIKVGHDIENFVEERQVILTLRDQEVLTDEGDELINVNMVDDEKYKKNLELRRQDPRNYGYDVYEEQYNEFGEFIGRGMLSKYDDEIIGPKTKKFTIGESKEIIVEKRRKALEIKAKLQNKRLENLNIEPFKITADFYTEEELTKFKKPKKKVKKTRQKLKADDLLEIPEECENYSKDHGSRRRRNSEIEGISKQEEEIKVKLEVEEEELDNVLKKARRIKQKENVIKKEVFQELVRNEPKNDFEEVAEENNIYRERENGLITLNQTAEFCRTLGDIPTYGMSGNRENDEEMMDIDRNSDDEILEEVNRGKWNAIDPNVEIKLIDGIPEEKSEEVAILDEEPDVATGVAAALNLAKSKGYIEMEDSNRPSNTRLAHLLAQNYSIDDKTHGEDDKYSKRGSGNSERYMGSLMEFKEKSGYRPNVKLEYIDDNNQKLTPKEAFRYLSHKFHGKGPGKNKIEKRQKKVEQEGLMMKMSSSDTPLNTLTMLQNKQKESQSAYIVLSGSKANQIGKNKR